MKTNPSETTMRISIIIPAYNAASTLKQCLESVFNSDITDFECLVVDDGSNDQTGPLANEFPVRYLQVPDGPRGPAYARNIGARQAIGETLFFIDSDVVIPPGGLQEILRIFTEKPEYAALFGAYDEDPAEIDFLSQYKNLAHHYFHLQANEDAGSFWSGCGAIRRDVFFQCGEFDAVRYTTPSIEDIELGRRMIQAGYRIYLDKTLQVKHLKRWTLWGLIRTDVKSRAIPWTLLIMQEKYLPNDLNLSTSQRLSAILSMGVAGTLLAAAILANPLPLGLMLLAFFLSLPGWNWRARRIYYQARPWALTASVLALAGVLSAGVVTQQELLIYFPGLMIISLIAGQFLSRLNSENQIGLFGLVITLFYLTFTYLLAHTTIWLLILGLLGVGGVLILNRQFFHFFSTKRGIFFSAAVIPMQILYYLYSVLAFVIAGVLHIAGNRSSTAEINDAN